LIDRSRVRLDLKTVKNPWMQAPSKISLAQKARSRVGRRGRETYL
jgi:hypothetical protein